MKLLVGLLITGCCFAQGVPQSTREDAAMFTNGTLNGRLWKDATWPPRAKESFLDGIWTATSSLLPTREAAQYLPSNLTASEVSASLDRFYAEPENLVITVLNALRVVTLKTNGADPDTIARVIAEMRRRLAEPPKPKLQPQTN